jgi:hypothetical protein
VRKISGEYIANYGYNTYLKAYTRYREKCVSELVFKQNHLRDSNFSEIFDYWGVFVKDNPAGFCKVIMDEDFACLTYINFDPDYFKYNISAVLLDTLANYYVVERKMKINNSEREIFHTTQFHNFLCRQGFHKIYCTLNTRYNNMVGIIVHSLYPFRKILPEYGIFHKVKAVLLQEEIRREQYT